MQKKTTRNMLAQSAFALAVALYVMCPLANAGHVATHVDHGMYMGPNVAYINVSETSSDPLPLYGAPITVGDNLAFFEPASSNPSAGFEAQAGGGSGNITDGFLSLVIMAKPGIGITDLTFSEGGDYTMATLGNALAQVSASLNIFELSIVEVDGAPTVGGPIVLSDTQSVTINLPPNAATGLWNLSSTFNLDDALDNVYSNHLSYTLGATKIVAKINNTLTALSQPGSVAGIFKKNFDINPETRVPEPTTLALAALGLVAVLTKRKTA